MIDKLLLKHVGLPHVLDLDVHLVNFFGWMSQGGHSEQLLLFALFYQSTPSCLKVIGGVGWVVAHVIIVSAQSKELGFWFFRLRVRIWGLFEQGIGDLDSGLTTCSTWKPVGTGTRTRTWTRA